MTEKPELKAGDDLLTRLDDWHNGHKSRSVELSHDNGYGATCWCLELRGHGKTLICTECFFVTGAIVGEISQKPGTYQHAVCEGGDFDEWPGVHAVVELALRKADEYGL